MNANIIKLGDDGPRWSMTKREREEAQRRQDVKDAVRLAAFMSQGIKALAADNMKGMRGLDECRKAIAGGDEILNMMCAEFEEDAFQQSRDIQRGVFNEWGL